MSLYQVPGFICSFQYSLMQPPSRALQHRTQPETIPTTTTTTTTTITTNNNNNNNQQICYKQKQMANAHYVNNLTRQ